jgi:S-adenosylmethionine synthetase
MRYFSNEIVFRGHPDKVADQISAAILAECVKQDKSTRAGIEVVGGKGKIFITGEVTTKAKFVTEDIAKRVLRDVGYSDNYEIIDNLGKQSSDIAMGVDVGGAGDQGMMYGYACNDTEEMLPTAMIILQRFAKLYDEAIRPFDNRFLPDGKAQITGVYDDNFKLVKIRDFTISYQNTEEQREETDTLLKNAARSICAEFGITEIERFLINPTGKFLIGGFEGDAGLTGRKIVVDAYQGFANVGGGCQNGKDVTKVDFSASHMARKIACEYLKSHNLGWCEVQLSYAIGVAEPLAIYINSNIGYIEPEQSLYQRCTPANIIKELNLLEADYEEFAKYGHYTKAEV